MMPMFGLVGGLAAAGMIYLISWKDGKLEPQRLLLTGIAIATGLGAVTLFLTLKMDSKDFEMAAVWTSGSIYHANWKYIVSILPWLVVLTPFIYSKSHVLDALRLDEHTVLNLGFAAEKEKSILLLASIGIVSACVSVSGGIGFIGLMAPHIATRLVGRAHRRMLPACALTGAALVLGSDYAAKELFAPVEIPAGIIVAIIGVPYFLWLMYRSKKQSF